MTGKCLWKQYTASNGDVDISVQDHRPSMASVINAFVNAIQYAPKTTSSSRSEPILEPHYKLVSIVHKLVLRGDMDMQPAADLLQKQPFAPDKGAPVSITSAEDWKPYILKNLHHLRVTDKQHWNHRIVARVANIMYNGGEPGATFDMAKAAQNELKDSIFTKTMHIQVWKSDAERAGRHCVYMERYVRLMATLLAHTNDKASLEMLVKRVRKKGNEFYRFDKVWADCCIAYVRLIRKQAGILSSIDDNFKSETHEVFENLSSRLDTWLEDPRVSQGVKDAFKEINDLKKLNGTAMKSTPIDDLISDIWAYLHINIARTLPDPDQNSLANAQLDGGGDSAGPSTSSVRALGPMSLNNLVMDMNGTQIPVPVTIAGSEASRPRKTGISRREVLKRAEQAYSRMPDTPRPVPSSTRPRLVDLEPGQILGSNDSSGKHRRRSASAAGSTPRVRTPAGEAVLSTSTSTARAGGSRDDQEQEQEQEQDQDGDGDDDPSEQLESENAAAQANTNTSSSSFYSSRHQHQTALQADDGESVRGSVHDSADDESDLSDPPDMEDFDASGMFPGLALGGGDGGVGGEGEESSDDEEDEEEEEEEEEVGESGAEEGSEEEEEDGEEEEEVGNSGAEEGSMEVGMGEGQVEVEEGAGGG